MENLLSDLEAVLSSESVKKVEANSDEISKQYAVSGPVGVVMNMIAFD